MRWPSTSMLCSSCAATPARTGASRTRRASTRADREVVEIGALLPTDPVDRVRERVRSRRSRRSSMTPGATASGTSVELRRRRELSRQDRRMTRLEQRLVALRRRDPELPGPHTREHHLRGLVRRAALRRGHLLERLRHEHVVRRRGLRRSLVAVGCGPTSRCVCRRSRARGTTRRCARRPARARRAPRTRRAPRHRTSTRRTGPSTRP